MCPTGREARSPGLDTLYADAPYADATLTNATRISIAPPWRTELLLGRRLFLARDFFLQAA
jgi:hypothetical protein